MRALGVGTACVLLLFSAQHARAESPVDVEVIEEEEEDFFADEKETEEEEAPADEPPAKAGVRKNAKDAFDELEANEKGVAIKRKKKQRASSGDVNENVNQQ